MNFNSNWTNEKQCEEFFQYALTTPHVTLRKMFNNFFDPFSAGRYDEETNELKYFFRQNIEEFYLKGMSLTKLSQLTRVSRFQLSKLVMARGLPRPRRFSDRRKAVINLLMEGKHSQASIANAVGVSRQRVHQIKSSYQKAIDQLEGNRTYKENSK
jgi:predicted DNA-binding protein YlxM (UPF0122 family)